MTLVVSIVMIAGVAGLIVLPFLRDESRGEADPVGAEERHEREKNVALLAIREADFDLAMGKLSTEDHASLRRMYEQRALEAISALETAEPPAAAEASGGGPASNSPAAFCVACGTRFCIEDRFCAACGARRGSPAGAG